MFTPESVKEISVEIVAAALKVSVASIRENPTFAISKISNQVPGTLCVYVYEDAKFYFWAINSSVKQLINTGFNASTGAFVFHVPRKTRGYWTSILPV